jgi:methylated-DNA-[protein]-cysteine S-methyltransferase
MTPFAKKVYKVVLSIPLGQVRSYKWVARRASRPAAFRAVGQILKHNPLPLIIPCHRVINADGSLGGYHRGKKTKERLLKLEREIKEKILITKKYKR